MKRNRNWRSAGYDVTIRGGDGKLRTQEECFNPIRIAYQAALDMGVERTGRSLSPRAQVVADSGWYCPIPGKPLPPISAFIIPVHLR